MKKTIRTILYAAVFAVLAVSCQKEINGVEPETNTKETIEISINGLMGEYTQVDGTRAELVNTVRVSWKGGETVYVYDGTQCLGTLKASLEGTEDRYALLSTDGTHTVSTPASGTTTLTLVYSPLLTEVPTVSGGAISVSLASQSGSKAPFVAYATLDYTGTTITNAVVPFKFATSVIKVNCTGLKPGTAITSATLSNVSTVCKLTLSGAAAPSVSGVTNGTITRTGDAYFAADKVNEEGVAVFQIAAPKLGEASEARVLTVAQGLNKFEYKNFSKKALSAATSVNTVCLLVKVLPAGALKGEFCVGADKKVHFSKGNLTYNVTDTKWKFYEHQYDCAANGDASSTLISLFTWGYSASTSLNPKGETYVEDHTTDGDKLVYDKASSEGGDDWGVAYCESNEIAVGTWRTLSINEWQYLFDTRTVNGGTKEGKSYQRATINSDATSVYGMILYPDNYTSQTDATSYTSTEWTTMEENGCVFLPAAGYRAGSDVGGVGSNGYYWSSTAYNSDNAYIVTFHSSLVRPVDYDGRKYGSSVRLITEYQ